ncbi:DUF3224 domain-containing protein [Streptomyces sp. NPDC101118]|uniref:DUF3224 domain-containing protein n=1 Tax=Streptomyces sp. NPDC101118 TaxID=3366109 RepID=UPI003820E5FC
MSSTRHTTGRFRYADWTEEPADSAGTADAHGAAGTVPRLAGATVTNTFSGGIEAAGTVCRYTIAYLGPAEGTFTGLELLSGSLDGRKGGFVLAESGTFDADGTHCTFEVVPGSGTGELAGLRGTGHFFSPHSPESVAYAFDYELPGA